MKRDFTDLPAKNTEAPASRFSHGAVFDAARRGVRRLLDLQKPAGDWEGEMVWCSMILAQVIIVRTIVGRPYDEREREGIIRHFAVTQASDGAWGMHPESPGYVFFTALAYVALRLLGMDADAPMTAKARAWLHATPEGVKAIPTWGKFWLSLLGLYGGDGVNAVPPELFLLPKWLPFHPSRFYCHTRLIYLGMAYLSGSRFRAELPPATVDALRAELYPEGYDNVDFSAFRHTVAKSDLHVPVSRVLKGIYDLLGLYERHPLSRLRTRGLAQCLGRIVQEQRCTRYQGISPVSGILNCLALYAHDRHHPDLAASLDGVEAWRWEDEEEGIRYVGARSNSWDTAFAMQALCELPAGDEAIDKALARGRDFLASAQQTEEVPGYADAWRDPALGGWCFSDGAHRWPVSDCAAEALAALLALGERSGGGATFDPGRLAQAVRFILSRQNQDGGFGTYERRRGGRLLEIINPSEMFGQCMTELSYIECTASSLAALAHFRAEHGEMGGIDPAMARAEAFLRKNQQADGSYAGFWGINYTYAIFHVTKALRAAGTPPEDPCLQQAAAWLLGHQREDGGWGEHYSGCLQGRYVAHPQSQVVMTSWALLALMEILPSDHEALRRGVRWLAGRQLPDGSWPHQSVNGVFFGAAMLDYRLYHLYFPAWALARYARLTHPS